MGWFRKEKIEEQTTPIKEKEHLTIYKTDDLFVRAENVACVLWGFDPPPSTILQRSGMVQKVQCDRKRQNLVLSIGPPSS